MQDGYQYMDSPFIVLVTRNENGATEYRAFSPADYRTHSYTEEEDSAFIEEVFERAGIDNYIEKSNYGDIVHYQVIRMHIEVSLHNTHPEYTNREPTIYYAKNESLMQEEGEEKSYLRMYHYFRQETAERVRDAWPEYKIYSGEHVFI